jgi:hypothetical protein
LWHPFPNDEADLPEVALRPKLLGLCEASATMMIDHAWSSASVKEFDDFESIIDGYIDCTVNMCTAQIKN